VLAGLEVAFPEPYGEHVFLERDRMEVIEIIDRLNEFEEEAYQRFTPTEPVRTNPRTAYLISSARDLHNQAIKLLNAITDAPSVKTLTQAYELEIMATRVLESAPETAVYQSYHLFPAALIALLMNDPQKALACSQKLMNTSLPRALGKFVLDLTQNLAQEEIAVKAREACKRGIITNLPRKLQFWMSSGTGCLRHHNWILSRLDLRSPAYYLLKGFGSFRIISGS
jgi:hypothetical protein